MLKVKQTHFIYGPWAEPIHYSYVKVSAVKILINWWDLILLMYKNSSTLPSKKTAILYILDKIFPVFVPFLLLLVSILGSFWHLFAPSLFSVRSTLNPFWTYFSSFWSHFGPYLIPFRLIWIPLGLILTHFEPSLDPFEPILDPLWTFITVFSHLTVDSSQTAILFILGRSLLLACRERIWI